MTRTHPSFAGSFDWQKWIALILLGLITVAGTWYLINRASNTITISVPAHDLPMYHLITASDLTTAVVPSAELSSTALQSDTDLVDHYTRKPLPGGNVVLSTQLIPSTDAALTKDTTAISIPATAAMTFNGQLTSGNVIMVWEVPDDSTTSIAKLVLDQVLVLDILAVTPVPTDNTEGFPYVVMLAVPVNHQADILSSAAKGLLAFTLDP